MLPVIQENILLLKMIQVGAETLLGLLLGYLTGEALFKLRFALPGQPDSANFSKSAGGGSHPQILSGWRTGLFLVLCLSCNLLAIKIAYGVALLPGPFWGALVVFFIVGLALLLPARQRLVHGRPLGNLLFSAGLAGEVLLLAIVFLLLNAESLLLRPEAWPFVGGRALLLLSWHGLARFAEYLLLSLLLAAIVRLRPGARPPDRWACPVALAAVLILPLCLLGEVAATPRLAASLPFFTLAVPIPAIAAAVAFLLAAFWTGRMQAAFKSLLTLSWLCRQGNRPHQARPGRPERTRHHPGGRGSGATLCNAGRSSRQSGRRRPVQPEMHCLPPLRPAPGRATARFRAAKISRRPASTAGFPEEAVQDRSRLPGHAQPEPDGTGNSGSGRIPAESG
jgi:hypothetical protein